MAPTEELRPGLRRIVAPNPSPMTERGTNTYLLGRDRVTVIDPGPESAAHLAAILAALGGERVARILVTHAHRDHTGLAAALAARTGAPVLAFGDARAGRPRMPAAFGAIAGGRGVDAGFAPDCRLADGARLETGAGPVEAIWTPGHMGNHMTFLWDGAAFTGDLVMGWASSMISPPEGDVARFTASCRRVRERAPGILYPGHGAPVEAPADRIDWLLAHRAAREAQVLEALAQGPATAAALAERIYADAPAALLPAAARSVLAHLIDLAARRRVVALEPRGSGTRFALA